MKQVVIDKEFERGYADAWAERPRSKRSASYVLGYEEGVVDRDKASFRPPLKRASNGGQR